MESARARCRRERSPAESHLRPVSLVRWTVTRVIEQIALTALLMFRLRLFSCREGGGGGGWRNQIINVLSVRIYEFFSSRGVLQTQGNLGEACWELVFSFICLKSSSRCLVTLSLFFFPPFSEVCLTASHSPLPFFFSYLPHYVLLFFLKNGLVNASFSCVKASAPFVPAVYPYVFSIITSCPASCSAVQSICFYSFTADPLPERLKGG